MRRARLMAATSLVSASVGLWWQPATAVAAADQAVQIPVDKLLNGRSVSTLTGGVVVPWTDGVDQTDGLMTTAAEAFLHQSGTALPDDGVFAANDQHPQVVLHFSNNGPPTSPQIFYLHGAGNFRFDVPAGHYSKLFLFLLSSIGSSPLTVTMTYADASTTMQTFTLPDWGTGQPLPKDPPIFFNLIEGMHKWDKQDQEVDTPSHTITGVSLAPAADRVLSSVAVAKPNAGQYLIFWGATGVSSDVGAGGAGGSDGGAGDGAATDAGLDGGGTDGDGPTPPEQDAAPDVAAPDAPTESSAPSSDGSGGASSGGGGSGTSSSGCAPAGAPLRPGRRAGGSPLPIVAVAAALLLARGGRRRNGSGRVRDRASRAAGGVTKAEARR